MPTALRAENLSSGNIRHGFYTRGGGASGGVYASLNCGYGSRDERAQVQRNRALVAADIGVPETGLLTVYQIHSAEVAVVEAAWTADQAPTGDAMVSATPHFALGILSADCTPVLFADEKAGVIAAAHAGWRGAISGVLSATVEAMEGLGAARGDIATAVGPCIEQESYEVGPEFHEQFTAASADHAAYFRPSPKDKHHLFDLPGFVRDRLSDIGVGSIERVGGDTYADEERFFSYRRVTHRGESDYGRQISAICLTA